MAVLEARRAGKDFLSGGTPVAAVREVSLSINAGELVAITGPSGSGKSTLLHLFGGITRPTRGAVLVEGVDLAGLDDDGLALLRRRRIGCVFQRYNLFPEFTLEENVALPLVLDGTPAARAAAAAREALAAVGLAARAGHRPDALSGGEQQRGAIARALIAQPAVVLADEPTGALDTANGAIVMDLFRSLVRDRGQTVVLVTHDAGIAAAVPRRIAMRDGRVEADGPAGVAS
ncbi:MAG: ABC transporter ATP-binding protein [Planctomycetia bacterium]